MLHKNSKIFQVIQSLFVSYILTAVLLLLLAFLMYKMKLSVQIMTLGVSAVYVLSCLAGGFVLGHGIKKQRLLWGLLAGAVYFLILFLVSVAEGGKMYADIKNMVIVALMCLAGGGIGGTFG